MPDLVSVPEAAQILEVGQSRILQRIHDGSLPAEKIGNHWAIERNDIQRCRRNSEPGRPLSAKSSWDLIAVALNDQTADELAPWAKSRARSRLRNLLVHSDHASLDDLPGLIEHALRNRAERRIFVASPGDLPEIRDDQRIHLSGVSLPASNMSAGDAAEGYVARADLDPVIEEHLLTPASRARANVFLHVVDPAASWAQAALSQVARSPLALAADLAEHGGIREADQAAVLLQLLKAKTLP